MLPAGMEFRPKTDKKELHSKPDIHKKKNIFLHSKKLPADNSKYKGDNRKYV